MPLRRRKARPGCGSRCASASSTRSLACRASGCWPTSPRARETASCSYSVSPGDRRVEIVSTPAARRRLPDHVAGLAVLSMTSSFGVGDLVGGIVTGVRQLADAAGPPAAAESSVSGEVLPLA